MTILYFAVIDGKFSGWAGWGRCPTGGGGQQFRTRQCDNPPPANGGADCVDPVAEVRPCPNWSAWGWWSLCNSNGTQTRTRTCSNPAPVQGQPVCIGQSVETRNCDPDDGGCSQTVIANAVMSVVPFFSDIPTIECMISTFPQYLLSLRAESQE